MTKIYKIHAAKLIHLLSSKDYYLLTKHAVSDAAAVAIRGNLCALRDLLLQTPMQPSHLPLPLSGRVVYQVCVGGGEGIKRAGPTRAYAARRYHIKEREREMSPTRPCPSPRAHTDPTPPPLSTYSRRITHTMMATASAAA